ncbi:MAG: hypothetical protein KF718_24310 [Polyangiaceae bacterium]|nr:hypothetical protein [Polyangiaceae bacterium]
MLGPRARGAAVLAVGALGVAACGGEGDAVESLGQRREAVVAPLAQAYCSITVQTKGVKSMEEDYLPRVITCENGGANLQALKAQAIAARSVAYYAIATSGSICDSQGCQVYTCGAQPQAKHYQAVQETAGMYLSYASMLTYGFYVAGDSAVQPPGCKDVGGTTTKYITYNQGKTGTGVTQTTLGWVGPPGYGQNRGCMGQWGARCLENNNGYDYVQILRFYYGDDIQILKAPGPCTQTCTPSTEVCNGVDDDCDGEVDEGGVCGQAPIGYLDSAGCDSVVGWTQDPDEPSKSIDVHLYFGGPSGSGATGKGFLANVNRSDLCSALGSCEHGFEVAPPLSLFDGASHPVHAYGIDSQGGSNAELGSSPRALSCVAEIPQGVRRHVSSEASYDAWRLDAFWDELPLDDAQIETLPEGPALAAEPTLVRADDGSTEVWLVDGALRRHVPSPAAMSAWRFVFGDVVEKPAAEVLALTQGPPLRPRPVTVRHDDGRVELIDSPLSGGGSGGFGGGTVGSGGSGGSKNGNSQSSAVLEGDSGCSCRLPRSRTGSGWWSLAALGALFARRRRRHDRH